MRIGEKDTKALGGDIVHLRLPPVASHFGTSQGD